jgi:ZIP family zinc transporter
VLGFAAGLLGLVYFERRVRRVQQSKLIGPGAASVAEFELPTTRIGSPARQLALMIATGIGLHNFAEGLAIGQSAANDEVALALLLVIGFGLHNATEGFGIVAPLSGAARPSWAFLGLLGLIAGGPTFIGTLVGQAWVSETVSVAFLALAAGSILYVVMELVAVGRQLGPKELFAAGIVLGLVLGFATDFILVAAGA